MLPQENEDISQTDNLLETVLSNQHRIEEYQLKMMQFMAKLQTSMDYLAEYTMGNNSTLTNAPVPVERVRSPVNSVEELANLEESLKDDNVMRAYISNMKFVCGSEGKSNGVDCCYKLIDYFFTREFLTECSWTGNSRIKDENKAVNGQSVEGPDSGGKIPLKFYRNVRTLFLKLIIEADKDFTELKCEEFFKRVMKNSKQRLNAKTCSKHKNRPKNLKYTERKLGLEGEKKKRMEEKDD